MGGQVLYEGQDIRDFRICLALFATRTRSCQGDPCATQAVNLCGLSLTKTQLLVASYHVCVDTDWQLVIRILQSLKYFGRIGIAVGPQKVL